MGQEIFPVMRGGAGMEQEKSMRGGGEDPILRPHPAPLPSLHICLLYKGPNVYFLFEKIQYNYSVFLIVVKLLIQL